MGPLVARAVTLARFSPRQPVADVLQRSDSQEVTITSFEPFQELTTWPVDSDVMVTVLEGAADVRVGDQVVNVSPGDICIVPARTPGAVRARGGRLIVLTSTAPPPGPDQLMATSWPPEDHPVRLHDARDLLDREQVLLRRFVRELEGLPQVAEELPEGLLRDHIASLLKTYATDLTGLLDLEQLVLYPVVQRFVADQPGMSASVLYDRGEITTAVGQLEALCTAPLDQDGRARLAGLLEELRNLLERHLAVGLGSYLSNFDVVPRP